MLLTNIIPAPSANKNQAPGKQKLVLLTKAKVALAALWHLFTLL